MVFQGKLADTASRDQSMFALGHDLFYIQAQNDRAKARLNPIPQGFDRPPGCWTPPPPHRCLDTERPPPSPMIQTPPLRAASRGIVPKRKLVYSTIGPNYRTRPECIRPAWNGQSQLAFRRRWSINEIENMLRFKVASKSLSSSNLLSAYRMFFDEKRTDLTPEDFRVSMSKLCGDQLTLEETNPIFHKYDADGGGTLDADEFVNGVLIGVIDKNEDKGAQFTIPRYTTAGEPTARAPRVFRHYGAVGGTIMRGVGR